MMNMMGLGRLPGQGPRRWLAVLATVLAVCGVAGAVPSAALAGSSSGPGWVKQHLAVHPLGRVAAAMAYDGATGTAVLSGGRGRGHLLGDTWAWDGSTWANQHPPTSPPVLAEASMAYDGATGTVVLFGGISTGTRPRGGTWAWDGSTWTQQHPAASPPARVSAAMAYDAATGTVVLFGGLGVRKSSFYELGDTWTWDGSTWTQQHPAASPPARSGAAMAYDAATGTVTLFGGATPATTGGTWTWDGSTWTQQHPVASPPGRVYAAMAYDAATGTVVLFGGYSAAARLLGDTWTWDGSTWTHQHPAASPPARPLRSGDGLRRGHWHRGPVQRRSFPRLRPRRRHLDLGPGLTAPASSNRRARRRAERPPARSALRGDRVIGAKRSR